MRSGVLMQADRCSLILCVDAESNGLTGEILAIGALVVGVSTPSVVIDSFRCRAPWPGDLNPWVKDNVPPLDDCGWEDPACLAEDAIQMLERFWRWYRWWMCGPEIRVDDSDADISSRRWLRSKRDPDRMIVLADHAFPVETGLFSRAIALDRAGREFLGPNPLHELATIRLARQVARPSDPLYASPRRPMHRDHDPYDDAWSSAMEAADHLIALGSLSR